ncbi:VanZ family protein [Croceimicrobium sp.]|uniref:VanZ family protein n=1 Tax=Croceimicrobium sp. TaxID=2828340 RepID=UPI003BAA44E3
MRKPNKIVSYTPALLWGFLISYLTLIPGKEVPAALASLNDKLLHAAIFFLTAGLIIMAATRYQFKRSLSKQRLAGIWLVCVSFGALIEILQNDFVPGRNGDWMDFWANSLGAGIAVLLWLLFQGRRA